ncbi:MAG: TIGR02996 domain-containing protein [Planctomycetes bacterium]|nr:TIGR02996 domain-containing protein [Planctomycetota bacterium]
MTDLQALYAGICAQPDEDTPRLALADFLDEQGGKENAFRADFIRTHVRLAREEPWSEPWRELNKRWAKLRDTATARASRHKLPWVAHLKGRMKAFYFERGLVGELTLFSKRFVSEGASYFERDPIRGVKFVKLNSSMGTVKPEVLFGCPHLARLAKLDLDGSLLRDVDLAKLAASPHLTALRRLGLGGYHTFTGAALPKLLEALPALSELDVSGNWAFGDRHLSELARCKELSRLRVFDAAYTSTTARGILALVSSKHAVGLTVLRLAGIVGVDSGGVVTAQDGDPDHGMAIVGAVTGSKRLGAVQELDLRYRAIGDDGLKRIAGAATALPALRRLRLDGCGVTPAGAAALADSDVGGRLLYVGFEFNPGLLPHRKKLKKMFPGAHVEEPVPYEYE